MSHIEVAEPTLPLLSLAATEGTTVDLAEVRPLDMFGPARFRDQPNFAGRTDLEEGQVQAAQGLARGQPEWVEPELVLADTPEANSWLQV